jgi:hypothetical protein
MIFDWLVIRVVVASVRRFHTTVNQGKDALERSCLAPQGNQASPV